MTVDRFRLYAIGYSAGGFLVHHLGCQLKGISGIASISGEFYENPKFAPVKSAAQGVYLPRGQRQRGALRGRK